METQRTAAPIGPAADDPRPWIVSVDDHVVEPPTLWWDRLPARDRERGPRVVRDTCETVPDKVTQDIHYVKGKDGPVTDWWVYEDLAKPIPTVVACAGLPYDQHSSRPITYADMRDGCYDATARIADMDVNRMERSLCFPTVPRFCGQMFYEAKDRELALRCVEAFNDWMVEQWCGDSGGRLIPLCIVPLWDPVLAAREVERNAARGCRAVTFSEMPHNLGLPSIHDPSRFWDPFFRACNDTGTVICMHIGSGSKMADVSPFAPRGVNTALTFTNAQLSMVEWLLSGVLVRYPKLKLAYSESQIGWMPFVLERLDNVYSHRAYAQLDPIITEPPSTYVKGRIYGCFFDDETGLANRDAIGITQICFETDYPHQDTTWPHTGDVIDRMAAKVTPEELELIVRGNALAMLGLD